MLLLSDGQLCYYKRSEKQEDAPWHLLVKEFQSVCEACLWTPWVHLGDLQAVSQVQLVAIDSKEFRHAAKIHGAFKHLFADYAAGFVKAITQRPECRISDMLSVYTIATTQTSFRGWDEDDE